MLLAALPYLVLLAPFLVARIPPLVDYPNHLARFWLIGGGAARVADFYSLDWSRAATNVALDRLVGWLAPIAPPLAVGHMALVLTALLTPVGAAALNAALFRRPCAWWAALPIAAWPATLLLGFLSFQLGVGLALAFAAADALAQRRRPGAAPMLRLVFAAVLIWVHLFAFAFYVALVGAIAFGPQAPRLDDWRSWRARLVRAALAAAWCLAPFLAFLLHAHALPAFAGAQGLRFGAFTAKLRALGAPLLGYNLLVDLPLAVAATILVSRLARRGRLQVHAGLVLAACGLGALAVLAPDEVGDSSWLDARFALMGLLALLTGLSLAPRTAARDARAVALAALALVAARTAGVAWAWAAMEPCLTATESAIAELPQGARVLPLQHRAGLAVRLRAPAGRYLFNVGDAAFGHYALLATPLRQAFVPTVFALRGKQPVQVRDRWAACSAPDGGRLTSVDALGKPPGAKDPAFLNRWRSCFDYVLVLNADLPDAGGPFIPPRGVRLVADRGFAQLWRISPLTGR